jgi:hypothetical protein
LLHEIAIVLGFPLEKELIKTPGEDGMKGVVYTDQSVQVMREWKLSAK